MIKVINVYRNTRVMEMTQTSNIGLGVETDNNVDMLKFVFDDFINGTATLLTDLKDSHGDLVAFPLTPNQDENAYELEITNAIVSKPELTFQIEIAYGEDKIWHSKQATLQVDDCLEIGEGTMPTTIENWLQNANLVMSGYADQMEDWQHDIDEMQDDIDQAISECETATSGAEKVDISQSKANHIITITTTNRDGEDTSKTIQEPLVTVSKQGKVTTITATDSDGTTTAQVKDGADFEYNWQGTSLGVKNSDQSEYEYVNLKGDRGDANFPILDINNQAHLIMYSETELENIDFILNDNGHLIERIEV